MNVSRALNQGVETALNLKLVPNLLSLAMNYTYLLAQNDDVDDRNYYQKYLVYRPKNTLNITLDASWQTFTSSLSWQYVSYRYVLPANTIWLDPYQVTNLTLGWRYAQEAWNLDVTLQVKNLFDEHYEFIQYQPIPGREYRLNVGIGGNLNK
jgi:outer membrane cobalamin receptor